MRVEPVVEAAPIKGKVSTIMDRPDSVMHRFRIEKIEEQDYNGVSIGGCYISGNCNIFLLVMATIFTVGGIIFTAISYRPRDHYENMDRYNDRQESEDGSQTKIVGPFFVLIGLVMLFISLVLYFIFWYLKKDERARNYELSHHNQQETFQRTISQVEAPYVVVMTRSFSATHHDTLEEGKNYDQSLVKASKGKMASFFKYRPFSAGDEKTLEMPRRVSLPPNHVLNESLQKKISVWSESTGDVVALSAVMASRQISNSSYNENMMIGEEESDVVDFDESFYTSVQIPNFVSPTLKRDIACFPTSTTPSVYSPVVSQLGSFAQDAKHNGDMPDRKSPPRVD